MKGKSKESDSCHISLLNEDSDYYYNPEFSSSNKSGRNWDKNRDFERNNKYIPPPNLSLTGSVEIENQEQMIDGEKQTALAATCRICFEREGNPGDELIAPCACKGTSQFVHRSCLDNWRSVKVGYAFSHCTTCKSQFHLHINFLEGSCWRTAKFRMFVARDVLLVFLAVQMIISLLGGLAYLCDIRGELIKLIGHDWGHPVFFYYCCGAILTLALVGIFGLISLCTSYNGTGSYNSAHSSSEDTSVYCFNGPMLIDCSSSGSDGDFYAVLLVLVVVIIFAAIGIFYGIFAGSIVLQRIWQRHYHILTKRELTKEYVVEDLHGNYTSPKLDKEHAKLLRMLNLL